MCPDTVMLIRYREEKNMKKEIKTTLSKSVTALLNRTLTSSANASSSFFIHQPVEPSSLKKFKKAR